MLDQLSLRRRTAQGWKGDGDVPAAATVRAGSCVYTGRQMRVLASGDLRREDAQTQDTWQRERRRAQQQDREGTAHC